jgi:hypothetical protein
VGQVIWYIFGQYNSTSITISGVPPNTTSWTGPTAASIFQDIKSDNWNGTTPPTYGTPSTYGTTGYYISRNTGNGYFNNGIFRGDITGASGSFGGSLNAATGSFNGSLSIGSTPPVISGSTISSGSGLLATTSGSGTFAVGNSTQNLVFNSSGVYINGGQLSITNGSTPPSLSGYTMSGAGVLLTSSGTFAVGNSTNNFVFDGSNAYFTGGGTFSGNLSAAGGSFTGTVQVGSSPAISGNTMTGSGALINSSGTFALGSSSANIVNNGSSIYLNGFAQGTGSISSTVTVNSYSDTIVMPLSGSSFTTTRPANTIISSSGYIRIIGSWTTGTTPLYGKFLMQFKLLNSSTNLKNLYVQFGTPCYVTSGTSPYTAEVWINYNVSTLITNLPADTYSFNLDGPNFYANAQWYSGGSILSTVTTTSVILQSSSYWYQVG